MTRLRRVVAVHVPHHLTQRGNARQYILNRDEDRAVYLKLLRENIEAYKVTLLGYCLMSNHVHLIAAPELADGLALAFRNAHGRYAAYWNAIHGASGHAWQGRFYSCPLDEVHLWTAMRYTEMNPVRAGLVSEPESWPWSSAAVHCGKTEALHWLDDSLWRNRWTVSEWREYLTALDAESDLAAIRQCTHTGRPLGDAQFVLELEKTTGRRLIPRGKKAHKQATVRIHVKQVSPSMHSEGRANQRIDRAHLRMEDRRHVEGHVRLSPIVLQTKLIANINFYLSLQNMRGEITAKAVGGAKKWGARAQTPVIVRLSWDDLPGWLPPPPG